CISRRVGQIFIESAIAGESMQIAGDGEDRLDFTYIDDLVQGLLRVIGDPAARNETFNLTYGEARTVGEVASIVQSRYPETSIEYLERDRLMPMRGTLDVTKARELLGYEPRNPIDVGIPRYIDWYRELIAGRVYA